MRNSRTVRFKARGLMNALGIAICKVKGLQDINSVNVLPFNPFLYKRTPSADARKKGEPILTLENLVLSPKDVVEMWPDIAKAFVAEFPSVPKGHRAIWDAANGVPVTPVRQAKPTKPKPSDLKALTGSIKVMVVNGQPVIETFDPEVAAQIFQSVMANKL